MPVFTTLHASELNIPLHAPEVQKLLEELRTKTQQEWQIVPLQVTEKPTRWFVKPKITTLYGLYHHAGVGSFPEWQVINFYKGDATTSVNHFVSLDVIAAYLMGRLD